MDINYDKLFRFMCKNGYLNDVKKLYNLKPNIDISSDNEFAFRLSCIDGHLDVAKWLLEIKPNIDISTINERVFILSCIKDHLVLAKWLLEIKPTIDISADNEFAFRWSCVKGRLDLVKWLLEIKPTIDMTSIIDSNNINNQQVIKWLVSLNNHGLTYKIIDGKYKLYKQIKTIKKDNIVFSDKCCVCLEEANCLTECNHEICIGCVNSLKTHNCPLCRKAFKFCYV